MWRVAVAGNGDWFETGNFVATRLLTFITTSTLLVWVYAINKCQFHWLISEKSGIYLKAFTVTVLHEHLTCFHN
jgi:hypothetical protein